MTAPPTDDAALATVLTRIEVKLDNALTGYADHETRLRDHAAEIALARKEAADARAEAAQKISPKSLWVGICATIAAGAGISTFIANIVP